MTLRLARDPAFDRDLEAQFEWFFVHARPGVEERLLVCVYQTLQELLKHPEMGRLRRFRDSRLAGFRSWAVAAPFSQLIVFYRVEEELLTAKRLVHGARDIPRRLIK